MSEKSISLIKAHEIRTLSLLLLLALAHGLLYLYLMPPWQHYDEPNHFEVAWLTAHLGRFPNADEFDVEISRAVLESMINHGFYDRSGDAPAIPPVGEEVRIPGFSQFEEPPLYYYLVSIPLRWMDSATVEQQLYAARMVSLLLFILTVWIAWMVAGELTPLRHPLRWMLPFSVALLPAFTDLMTAVNNDSAAVMVFSFFFWGAIRLLKRGFSWLVLVWVTLAAALTYFVKNTAMIAILALPLVVLFAVFRGRFRWVAWVLLVSCIAIGVLVCIRWDDAAYWHRSTSQSEPTHSSVKDAVLGQYVFKIESQAAIVPRWLPPLFQPLPPADLKVLKGKSLTLGAWIWASQSVEVTTLKLEMPGQSWAEKVIVDQTPQFFALHVTLPENPQRIWISIEPRPATESPVSIYFDGLVLASGEFLLDEPPRFSTPDGDSGEWGGKSFINLLRNPSAEQSGPRLVSWLDNRAANFLPNQTRPSLIISSLLDWQGAGFLYKASAQHLFQTFWARFSWGHIPLEGKSPYRGLEILSAFCLAGAVIGALRRWRRLSWAVVAVILWILLLSWGATLSRGVIFLALDKLYIPTARHAYPVIIPVMLVFCAGWYEWIVLCSLAWEWLLRKPRFSAHTRDIWTSSIIIALGLILFLAIFFYLDWISLRSIIHFY